MTKTRSMKTVKCADWLWFSETVKKDHEAHEWWDSCRGIRWCPGVKVTS